MYNWYRSFSGLVSPLVPFWLSRRRRRGKETDRSISEKLGNPSLPRPDGRLLWVHAASVGEANAIYPLLMAILEQHPSLHVLFTTGTITSAELLGKKLPKRVMHQFLPVDTPSAVKKFIRHWHPNVGIFVDSEFWPNLLMEAYHSGTILCLVNGRISEASYKAWKRRGSLIREMLEVFRYCSAQSKTNAERLLDLGMRKVHHVGNLKYDSPPLEYDEAKLKQLKDTIGDRPVWLAASTHPGEEGIVQQAHEALRKKFPDLLTIIVPRHATRGDEIEELLSGHSVVRRSRKESIQPDTEIYLADTMGELGLFYRLARVALIGGSLVPHGGQNPIEPVKLGCPVIMGKHMFNFQHVVRGMEEVGACIRIVDGSMLPGTVARMIEKEDQHRQLAKLGRDHIASRSGNLPVILSQLGPYLSDH